MPYIVFSIPHIHLLASLKSWKCTQSSTDAKWDHDQELPGIPALGEACLPASVLCASRRSWS